MERRTLVGIGLVGLDVNQNVNEPKIVLAQEAGFGDAGDDVAIVDGEMPVHHEVEIKNQTGSQKAGANGVNVSNSVGAQKNLANSFQLPLIGTFID